MAESVKTQRLARELDRARREMQIQDVLERIREVALRMQTTEDIGAVAFETRNAMKDLGIQTHRVTITLVDEASDTVTNLAALEKTKKASGGWESSLSQLRESDSVFAQKGRSGTFRSVRHTKRPYTSEVRKYYKALKRPPSPDWVEEVIKANPFPFYTSFSYFSGGMITIGTDQELAKDEIAIVRRLTKTFDFAYKRYVDLQKAEQRARDAEVEAALERVRGQALAMEVGSEIRGIAKAIRVEYERLGYNVPEVEIGVSEPELSDSVDAPIKIWRSSGYFDSDDPPLVGSFPEISQQIKEAKCFTNDGSWIWKDLERRLRGLGLTARQARSRLSNLPEKLYDNMVPIGVHFGGISFFTDQPFTEADFATARRFGEVFGVAYRRHLELEEKDSQNRELTIQNALERVRARAQGMQESEALREVVWDIFEEARALGFEVLGTAIVLFDEVKGPNEVWGAQLSHRRHDVRTGRISDLTFVDPAGLQEAREQGELWQVAEHNMRRMRGRQRTYLAKQGLSKREIDRRIAQIPDRVYRHRIFFSEGVVAFHAESRFETHELEVLKRFADAFDFAYKRFVDLQAKEEQNRELTIQNAVERVRAKTEGMQESQDIAGVVETLFDAFSDLGFDPVRTHISIEEGPDSILYNRMGQRFRRLYPRDTQVSGIRFKTKERPGGIPSGRRPRRSTAGRWDVKAQEGKALVSGETTWHAFFGWPTEPVRRLSKMLNGRQVSHGRPMEGGNFNLTCPEQLGEDQLAVADRLVEVFEHTYGRFRELQQKEAQNRELTIQNALERLRVRALGVEENDDLAGVAYSLFREFEGLGLEPTDTAIIVWDKERDERRLVSGGRMRKEVLEHTDEEMDSRPFVVTRLSEVLKESPHVKEIYDAWERGDAHFETTRRNPRGLRAQIEERRAELGKRADWVDRKLALYEETYTSSKKRHFFNFSSGTLRLSCSRSLDDDDLDVVRRSVEVFDFAYNRVRDLLAKEEQIREQTILNALERVRSRALGMQESSEISSVIASLYDVFEELGYDLIRASTIIFEGDEEVLHEKAGKRYQHIYPDFTQMRFPHEAHRQHIKTMKWDHLEGLPNPWKGHVAEGAQLVEEESWWNRTLGIRDRSKAFARAVNGRCLMYWCRLKSEGTLTLTASDTLSNEQLQTASRFVEVYDYSLGRFLELKQKEAQNRELAVEAALERVRSRALAMESFDDLNGVAHALYEALDGLGYSILRSTINVFDRDTATLSAWVTLTGMMRSPGSQDTVHELSRQRGVGWLKRGDLPPPGEIRDRVVAWQKGDVCLHQVREGAPGDEYREFLQDTLRKSRSGLEEEIDWDRIPEVEHHCSIFNAYGWVQIASVDPLSEDQTAIAKRFVDLFAFAYSRFKELDAKEHANRELAIEAALERVRSRALGMEGTDELSEVAGTIYEEIDGLGMEPMSASIYIRDDGRGTARIYARGMDGSTIEGWTDLNDDPSPVREQIEAARAAGEPYFHQRQESVEEIKIGLSAIQWSRPLNAREYDAADVYWFIFATGSLVLPFDKALAEWETQALSRFADTFGFAYDRYLQIEATERQNQQLRLDAALERVHANVASMQTTDDIGAMMGLVYREIEGLGIDLFSGNIVIVDEEKRETRQFALIPQTLYEVGVSGEPEAKNIVEGIDVFRGDRPIHETGDEIYSVWKSGRGQVGTPPGTAKERKGLVEALKSQFGLTVPEQELPRSVMRVPFSHGVLLFYARQEDGFSQDDLSAVGEFAEMVTLGYARYLDFQRLEAQNQELAEANERVLEATRMKSQFLATMSHELRTPMNAIVGFTQLVLRRGSEQLSDRHRGNLEKVKTSADHLLNLINDILDLSKVEAGRVDIQATDFELKPLLEQACSTVGPTLGKPGVEVVCNVADDIPMMHTDEARLRQVVINLLSNAFKFTDEGSVTVAAGLQDGREANRQEGETAGESQVEGQALTISVTDTGIGIPEDQLGRIFEEFRQVDGSSTRRHQGTGLGLAITRRLVELMGGGISVSSVVGEGSRFVIEIPAVYRAGEQAQGRAGEEGEERVQSAESSSTTLGAGSMQSSEGGAVAPGSVPQADSVQAKSQSLNRTIVSIDDDPNVGILLREMLEEDGFKVISALNADEGVALVKKHQPAAVTVDILMPGKDGWVTIGMLKEDPATRDIPVIVVSGMANRELGFSMGVKDYVVKPFDQDAIVGALKRISADGVKDILVVDDEPSACELVCEMLDETGYETRRASNGKQALEQVEKKVPDAMFLDLMMPEMDGFGVIEALEENEAWREIPVIVVTAKDLTIAEEDYLKARVEKVVQKGQLEVEELRRLINDDRG
jgi:signal transduction histidine kinase/DNA-binding response OmpR family regulator